MNVHPVQFEVFQLNPYVTICLHFTDSLQDETGDVRYIQKQNSNLSDEFSALSGDVSEMAWNAIQ